MNKLVLIAGGSTLVYVALAVLMGVLPSFALSNIPPGPGVKPLNSTLNDVDPTRHIQVVLNGLQGANVGGIVYPSPMPAFGTTRSDAEVASIINYERTSVIGALPPRQ